MKPCITEDTTRTLSPSPGSCLSPAGTSKGCSFAEVSFFLQHWHSTRWDDLSGTMTWSLLIISSHLGRTCITAQGPPDPRFALHWPSEGLQCVETSGLGEGQAFKPPYEKICHAFPPPELLWGEPGLCSCLSKGKVWRREICFIFTFLKCFG